MAFRCGRRISLLTAIAYQFLIGPLQRVVNMARIKKNITETVVAALVNEHLREARLTAEAVQAASAPEGAADLSGEGQTYKNRYKWDPVYRQGVLDKQRAAWQAMSPEQREIELQKQRDYRAKRRANGFKVSTTPKYLAMKANKKMVRDEKRNQRLAEKQRKRDVWAAKKQASFGIEKARKIVVDTSHGHQDSVERGRVVGRAKILKDASGEYGRTMTIRHSMDRLMLLNDFIVAYAAESRALTLRSFYSYLNESRPLKSGIRSPYVVNGELQGDTLKQDISLLADEPTVLNFFAGAMPAIRGGDTNHLAKQAVANLAVRYPDQMSALLRDMNLPKADPGFGSVSGISRDKVLIAVLADMVIERARKNAAAPVAPSVAEILGRPGPATRPAEDKSKPVNTEKPHPLPRPGSRLYIERHGGSAALADRLARVEKGLGGAEPPRPAGPTL